MDFSYCGLDCNECPVYLATISKNTDEQIKLANEYSTDVTKFSKEDMYVERQIVANPNIKLNLSFFTLFPQIIPAFSSIPSDYS